MPKMKTNRGAAKRFKRTASGAYKHRKANRNHILTKKATGRKRHLRGNQLVNAADVASIKQLLVDP